MGEAGFGVYAEFVEKVLAGQDVRKASIEQRAVMVVTTSGTLITLLFAVIGLATRNTGTFSLTTQTRNWLIAAVVLLLSAAAFGIAANAPLQYRNVRAADLRLAVDELWDEDSWTAAHRITLSRIDMLEQEARLNAVKAWLLFTAVCLEGAALAPLSVALVQLTG